MTAGVLKLDSERVADCLSQLGAQRCDEWATLPEACQRFLLPRVPLGQPCYDGYEECLDEGVCRGTVCPRTCQPRASSGERCTADGECRAGLLCRMQLLDTGVGTCLAQSSLDGNCVRDGVDFNMACIPSSFRIKSTESFDPAYMTQLFQLAYRTTMEANGYPWEKVPPGYDGVPAQQMPISPPAGPASAGTQTPSP